MDVRRGSIDVTISPVNDSPFISDSVNRTISLREPDVVTIPINAIDFDLQETSLSFSVRIIVDEDDPISIGNEGILTVFTPPKEIRTELLKTEGRLLFV